MTARLDDHVLRPGHDDVTPKRSGRSSGPVTVYLPEEAWVQLQHRAIEEHTKASPIIAVLVEALLAGEALESAEVYERARARRRSRPDEGDDE